VARLTVDGIPQVVGAYSYSWGVTVATSGGSGGGGAGVARLGDFMVTKPIDVDSPRLAVADTPTESVSFTFGRIQETFADSSLPRFCFDLRTGRSC
jgi:type VI protein secretion system component Hcp